MGFLLMRCLRLHPLRRRVRRSLFRFSEILYLVRNGASGKVMAQGVAGGVGPGVVGLEVSLHHSFSRKVSAGWLPVLVCLGFLFVPAGPILAGSEVRSRIDGGRGKRRVWMREHRIRIQAAGPLLSVQEEIRLQGGWDAREYRYRFFLPKGAVITGFKVEREGHWSTGRLLDARYADREYEDLSGLPSRPDPGLVRQVGPDEYLVRVWPVAAGRPVRFLVHWAALSKIQEGRRVLVLPALPRDRRLVETKVLVQGKGAAWRTQKLGHSLSVDLGPVTGRPPLSVALARTKNGPAGCGAAGSRAVLLSLAGVRSAHEAKAIRLLVLVDRSRSMWPGSARQATRLVTTLGKRLGPRGRLALLAFDRTTTRFSSGWVRPSAGMLRKAGRWLVRTGGNNGTNLTGAFLEAGRLFASVPAAERSRRILVLLTDGLLPQRFSARRVSGLLRGVELVALVGSAGSGSGQPLTAGPVARRHGSTPRNPS